MGPILWITLAFLIGTISYYILPRFRDMSYSLYLLSVFWSAVLGGTFFSLIFFVPFLEPNFMSLFGALLGTLSFIILILITSGKTKHGQYIHTNL